MEISGDLGSVIIRARAENNSGEAIDAESESEVEER